MYFTASKNDTTKTPGGHMFTALCLLSCRIFITTPGGGGPEGGAAGSMPRAFSASLEFPHGAQKTRVGGRCRLALAAQNLLFLFPEAAPQVPPGNTTALTLHPVAPCGAVSRWQRKRAGGLAWPRGHPSILTGPEMDRCSS